MLKTFADKKTNVNSQYYLVNDPKASPLVLPSANMVGSTAGPTILAASSRPTNQPERWNDEEIKN